MNSVHVHVPYSRIGEYLSLIKHHKLNLEIYFPSSSLDSLKPADLESLKRSLDYNPSLSIHAPFMDLSPGAVDSKVRDITTERFSHVMDIAGILSPKAIVFHSGYEKWKYDHNVGQWLEASISTWMPIIERAAQINTRIAIENIFEDEPSNLEALMKELHSEHFGICFDTGHWNLFSTIPLTAWMESLRDYIYELHLHDNDKSFDAHLPIGDGTFDFSTFFSALNNRSCLYTIEAHSPEKVIKSIERLNRFLNE